MEKQETLKNTFKQFEWLSNISKDEILLSIFMDMLQENDQLFTFLEHTGETIVEILDKFVQRHEVFERFIQRIPASMPLKEVKEHVQIQEKEHYYVASYFLPECEEEKTFYTLYHKEKFNEIGSGNQMIEVDNQNVLMTNREETIHISMDEEGNFVTNTSFPNMSLKNAENLGNGCIILRSEEGDFLYSTMEKKKITPLFTSLKKEETTSSDEQGLLVGTLSLSSTVQNAPQEEKVLTVYMDMTATKVSPLCDLNTSRTLCIEEAGWDCDFKSFEIQRIKDELNQKALRHKEDWNKKSEIKKANQEKLKQYIKK